VNLIKPIISSATAKFGPALVLALGACSITFAQDVRTNYMPGTDWSTLAALCQSFVTLVARLHPVEHELGQDG
jgi:hypothetical protein